MATINESTWNPIKLGTGGTKEGYKINAYSVSSSWYNKILDNTGNRYNRLRRYDQADKSSVEIARALDILAEDISSMNADDNEPIYIHFPDDAKVKKTTLKLMETTLASWMKRSGFEEKFFDRVRYLLKYGAKFFKKNPDGTLKHLHTERFVGYILSEADEDIVTHYIYDPNAPRIDEYGKNIQKNFAGGGAREKDYEIIPIDDLFIMKIGEGPFGESVIEKVYRTWRQMSLLEDAIVIYRVTRSIERRVYYIDVGNLQGPKREAAIERQRLRLMQKQTARGTDITTEYDPHSTTEDIFIPTNSTGKGSRVETLPGGQNLGEVGDLQWFAKKMAAGLRIPQSMVDVQSDDERHTYNDMRVGQHYQIEMRYMGYIKRFQKILESCMYKLFEDFAKNRGIEIPEEACLKITQSMSFALYKEIEINQALMNVYSSTQQFESLSKRYALQKYMNFDQEELQLNEYQKLREKGLADDVIKKMPQEHIENIVYGDGSKGKEYGLEAEAGGGRGW